MKIQRLLSFVLALSLPVAASAQCQIVTLTTSGPIPNQQLAVSPNQVVTLLYVNGYPTNGEHCYLTLTNGSQIDIIPQSNTYITGSATLTGITNIYLTSSGLETATFSIKSPSSQSYVPANAVVIPSDATGPVQIILESSSDLVNWNAALPGTYGSTYSNRFFRVRAVVQQQ